MMHMYSTTGTSKVASSIVWLHLHWFFGAIAIVGFILLTVWALKSLHGKKLQSLTIWLLVVGIIGTLITAPLGIPASSWMMKQFRGGHDWKEKMMEHKEQSGNMMNMMMEHSKESEHEDHEEIQKMMSDMMGPWHDKSGIIRKSSK